MVCGSTAMLGCWGAQANPEVAKERVLCVCLIFQPGRVPLRFLGGHMIRSPRFSAVLPPSFSCFLLPFFRLVSHEKLCVKLPPTPTVVWASDWYVLVCTMGWVSFSSGFSLFVPIQLRLGQAW
eukprot:RCo052089